ncbi:MAG: hypothetical protein KQH53_15915 [Desulfarculaceae bacterium]|nr:hypothetical protein [Desulfarculaceae bacterium]
MDKGELQELKHEAKPGYRPVLWALVGVAVAWLVVVFSGVLASGGA